MTAAKGGSMQRTSVRRLGDVGWVAAGLAVLTGASLAVNGPRVPASELQVFRAINDHTVLPFVVVWPLMQLGNLLAVPVAAAAAALTRRFRLAVGLLLGGAATYLLAKVVKGIVVRGRPDGLLDEVRIRGTAALGRGYVSGHAAVVTLIAVLVWPYLGPRARVVLAVLAVVVCWARVYVGAHLPLDVVGGAALGLAVGAAVRLLLGRPVRARPQ